MFTKEQLNQMMLEIKHNNELLDQCPAPFHEFTIISERQRTKRGCKHCKGTIDVGDVYWYGKGLDHGRAHQQSLDADPGLAGSGQ